MVPMNLSSFLLLGTFSLWVKVPYDYLVFIGSQVHERGKRIVVYNIVTLSVANLTPIAGGHVSEKYGWPMQFHILIAFTALALLVIVFGCPEHGNCKRSAVFGTDKGITRPLEEERKSPTQHQESGISAPTYPSSNTTSDAEAKQSYPQQLRHFATVDKSQIIIVVAIRPFACFLYLAVFWGFTVGGLWSSWVGETVKKNIFEALLIICFRPLASPLLLLKSSLARPTCFLRLNWGFCSLSPSCSS